MKIKHLHDCHDIYKRNPYIKGDGIYVETGVWVRSVYLW